MAEHTASIAYCSKNSPKAVGRRAPTLGEISRRQFLDGEYSHSPLFGKGIDSQATLGFIFLRLPRITAPSVGRRCFGPMSNLSRSTSPPELSTIIHTALKVICCLCLHGLVSLCDVFLRLRQCRSTASEGRLVGRDRCPTCCVCRRQ